MGDSLTPKPTGQLKPYGLSSDGLKIAAALTKMAIFRNGEYTPMTLEAFSLRLSTEPFEDVMAAITAIGESPRGDHENACPDFGTLLLKVRALNHPHKHLRAIVTRLARIFGVTADEEFLMLYQEEAGHRTDADLDKAYAAIRGDETLKRMPTPAAFRSACGVPKIYQDGTRPA